MTWVALDVDYGTELLSVQGVDPTHAFILDDYDWLYATSDGGDNWLDVSIFPD